MDFEHTFVKNTANDTPIAPGSKDRTTKEEPGASTWCDEINIKEEPVFNDNYWEPFVEIKQISSNEDNVKLEVPEGQIPQDPLQLKKEVDTFAVDPLSECDPLSVEEEVSESPEAVTWLSGSIKEEPEVDLGVDAADSIGQTQMNSTGCDSEQESLSLESDSSSNCSGTPPMRDSQQVGTSDSIPCTAKQEEFHGNENGERQLALSHETTSTELWGPEEHRHVDGGDSLPSCTVCHKTFKWKHLLKRHLRVHTGDRPYSCDVCSKTFADSSTLRQHSLLHTGQRSYSCSFCSKTFTLSSHLNRHLLLHTGQRPYSCGVCSKTFADSSCLKQHSLLHTGQRPYSCSVCNKTFTQNGTLKRHLLVHSEQQPYSCDVCHKTFRQSHNLKKHLRTHTGQRLYSCGICSKTFTDNSSVKRHLLLHSEESRPYSCGMCHKTFTRREYLEKHSWTHAEQL